MTDDIKGSDSSRAALRRPFEPVLSQEASNRLTRITKTMFNAADAQIILVENGVAWHSRMPMRTELGPGISSVIQSRKPIWVEDGRCDPRFAGNAMVAGAPYLRFFAAHPISLRDGSIPGVLAVFDTKTHAFDAVLADRLNDLAAIVADEWERAASRSGREQSLIEREVAVGKLDAVVKAMPVSLVIIDKDLNILGCSPRWAGEMDQTSSEVIGRSYSELRPDAFRKWAPTIARVLSGETIAVDKVRSSTPGTNRWLSVEAAPWRDVDGSVGGLIISSHDVTDMVSALESSEKSQRRLTLAMGLSKIHVWEMDYAERTLIKAGDEDNIFSEPKVYEELFQDPFCTVDPRDLDRVRQDWTEHLETGASYQTDYRVVRADEKEVWVSCSCDLVTDEADRPLRLIGALQNITERKAADQALLQARDDAEMATRAKSAFLATMSHEIRTPLNGVLGMAQAMAADPLPQVQRERLDVIRQSGQTLLTILNDILDLSKIEAGKLELEEVDFDLGEVCRATHAGFAAIAARKHLYFDLTVEEDAEGIYRSDSTRVRQILGNLISNALKFTAAGGVSVQVSRHGSAVELAVVDTGIGIPAQSLGQLFQKFEQVDASTTRKYGGTGLGLAICKELAEMLGGRIEASSKEGVGTTFRVFLPLSKVSDGVASDSVNESREAGTFESALRVLAAEDNSINQLVLKTLLNQAGIDPVIVADGEQAFKAWQERDWDLILMDVQMPNMDGPAATAAIRNEERQTGRRRTPILALTANAMSHQISAYKAVGMDGFVAKPIEVERLFVAMETALDEAETNESSDPDCSLVQASR